VRPVLRRGRPHVRPVPYCRPVMPPTCSSRQTILRRPALLSCRSNWIGPLASGEFDLRSATRALDRVVPCAIPDETLTLRRDPGRAID